jgi:hypothetical protein
MFIKHLPIDSNFSIPNLKYGQGSLAKDFGRSSLAVFSAKDAKMKSL